MNKRVTGPTELLPLRWRPRPPGSQSAGTLFQFVREFLCRNGGGASRAELLNALRNDPRMKRRLEQSQGFTALLGNMRVSGWIELGGEMIKATPKTVRRTLI